MRVVRRIARARALAAAGLIAALASIPGMTGAAPDAGSFPFEWRLPPGFPEPAVPADNPMSAAKVELGRRLFADTRLSVTGSHSCQSCHDPARAFTDGLPRSRGATGAELPVNAPTLLNVAYNGSFGWRDPAIRTLERQMEGPLFNEHPPELGLRGREAAVVRQFTEDPAMSAAFRDAFPRDPRPVSLPNVIRAIAAFERTLLAGGSRFDRYVFRGEHGALTDSQKRGMALFFSARTGCSACHGGINFAGPWVDRDHPEAEPVFADTGAGSVRVPTLRNLGATAPYLHDGSAPTLEAVLARYERLAGDPGADPRLRRVPLTTGELRSLRDFLRALDESP